jgi:hypothetical protein
MPALTRIESFAQLFPIAIAKSRPAEDLPSCACSLESSFGPLADFLSLELGE